MITTRKHGTHDSLWNLGSKSWFGLTFVAAVAIATTLSASSAFASDNCMFRMFPPIMALPYSIESAQGAGRDLLRGVQLYVPVDNMLTQDELITEFKRELTHADGCGPRIESIEVSALPHGAGLWIRLLGRDEGQARELLAWAVGLVRPASARLTRVAES